MTVITTHSLKNSSEIARGDVTLSAVSSKQLQRLLAVDQLAHVRFLPPGFFSPGWWQNDADYHWLTHKSILERYIWVNIPTDRVEILWREYDSSFFFAYQTGENEVYVREFKPNLQFEGCYLSIVLFQQRLDQLIHTPIRSSIVCPPYKVRMLHYDLELTPLYVTITHGAYLKFSTLVNSLADAHIDFSIDGISVMKVTKKFLCGRLLKMHSASKLAFTEGRVAIVRRTYEAALLLQRQNHGLNNVKDERVLTDFSLLSESAHQTLATKTMSDIRPVLVFGANRFPFPKSSFFLSIDYQENWLLN